MDGAKAPKTPNPAILVRFDDNSGVFTFEADGTLRIKNFGRVTYHGYPGQVAFHDYSMENVYAKSLANKSAVTKAVLADLSVVEAYDNALAERMTQYQATFDRRVDGIRQNLGDMQAEIGNMRAEFRDWAVEADYPAVGASPFFANDGMQAGELIEDIADDQSTTSDTVSPDPADRNSRTSLSTAHKRNWDQTLVDSAVDANGQASTSPKHIAKKKKKTKTDEEPELDVDSPVGRIFLRHRLENAARVSDGMEPGDAMIASAVNRAARQATKAGEHRIAAIINQIYLRALKNAHTMDALENVLCRTPEIRKIARFETELLHASEELSKEDKGRKTGTQTMDLMMEDEGEDGGNTADTDSDSGHDDSGSNDSSDTIDNSDSDDSSGSETA